MRRLRHFPFFNTRLWVVYLIAAVFFTQGLQTHVHVYNHAPTTTADAHHGYVHLASEAHETTSDAVTDIDLNKPGVVKNISFDAWSIALLMAVLILLTLPPYTPPSRYRNTPAPFLPWRGSQPPPLRGPPL